MLYRDSGQPRQRHTFPSPRGRWGFGVGAAGGPGSDICGPDVLHLGSRRPADAPGRDYKAPLSRVLAQQEPRRGSLKHQQAGGEPPSAPGTGLRSLGSPRHTLGLAEQKAKEGSFCHHGSLLHSVGISHEGAGDSPTVSPFLGAASLFHKRTSQGEATPTGLNGSGPLG